MSLNMGSQLFYGIQGQAFFQSPVDHELLVTVLGQLFL